MGGGARQKVPIYKLGERATKPLGGNWSSTGGGAQKTQWLQQSNHAGYCEQGC